MSDTSRREFLQSTVAGSLLLHAGWAEAQAPVTPRSPFLEGNFAPVRAETQAENLRVVGALPRALEGMFVRNGPNPQFPPRGRYHWFDGDGMIHGVRLRDGRASYRNRYVRTPGWEAENRAGRAIWTGLAEPPDLTHLLAGRPPFKNAANTALIWYQERLLALWEAGEPHALRLPDLHTLGAFNFGGRLNHPFTAHPKLDPRTGELVFFGYAPIRPYLRYTVANDRGEIVHTTSIELPRAVMMHDFAITERHSLFLDLPVTMDLQRLAQGQGIMRFQPELGARVGIIPRRGQGRDIRWFNIEPCYVFHTLNAWEDGDEVVLLGCRMETFPEEVASGGPTPANARGPSLHRWSFNLRTGAVRENAVEAPSCEFPRFRESLMGRATRFAYAGRVDGMQFDGLLKIDLQSGRVEEHRHGRSRFGGEGVFVPHPDQRDEDAGWLLTFVHDQNENRSEMVVVDTRDFQAGPVARVVMPARVPFGFHGTWVPGSQIP